ncbi:unnamed protein product [Effrenium voratum]|uniref:Phosphofructokinase domain-containing protein n=1 Tax=Effrenium voratum TaxID=2562239 RepID=A0AA36N5W9_9DINO|nr:unnamed protein product [Effrenium voratum]CAJ1399965.1 unnamed protein product [Effrenium voratum]CAJ1416242.1 unnamed protein product [Effrenium voratum]
MARFAFYGAKWWNHQAGYAALAAGTACGVAIRPSKMTAADGRPFDERSAANLRPYHLSSWQEERIGLVKERTVNKFLNPIAIAWPDFNFLNPDELVQGHIILNDSKQASRPKELANGCVRANACKEIWWNPSEVRAAIVTCGGLCPGLNSIIREITNCLWHQYGVRTVLGMQAGYNGCKDPDSFPPTQLTVDNVRDIHMKGGSILKAGRGGMDDPEKILDQLQKQGVNMLFTVGGDGTQAAANLLFQAAKKRNMPLSIVGVPKSIDNDIVFFDKTFGFDSAVAAASEVIRNGWVEATSCSKGVGIVKLMGRDAGFVAMHAALASTIVDLVMIPEVDVELEEVMGHVDRTLERKDFMVIAVAEGAGQKFVATGKKDSTGHTVYGDIGTYLKDAVNSHLKSKGGRSFYIDPSYIIRSVTIRPNDHIYCSRLARDAVHTAMRGYTGVCVGPIHNIIVVMPSNLIASRKKRVGLHSSSWQSCVQSCNMPKSLSGLN